MESLSNIINECKRRHQVSYFERRFPEFYNKVRSEYPTIENFFEAAYLYINKIKEPLKCPICGNRLTFRSFTKGYRDFCSNKCVGMGTSEKARKTCLEKYGVVSTAQARDVKDKARKTCLEKYGGQGVESKETREKIINTNLERYGTVYSTDPEKGKQTKLERYGDSKYNNQEKREKTCLEKYGTTYRNNPEKGKQTLKERYGDEHYNNIEKQRETCKERYGESYYVQTNEFKEKAYNTKKTNHTFNSSSIEIEFQQYLKDNHISYIYQYKNDKYPFMCDFYFSDKDIYLEINGFWYHGGHPYDPTNLEDKNKLDMWKKRSKSNSQYESAIYIWTISDPKKVLTAKDNNIDLKVFYGHKMNKLIDFCHINNIL